MRRRSRGAPATKPYGAPPSSCAGASIPIRCWWCCWCSRSACSRSSPHGSMRSELKTQRRFVCQAAALWLWVGCAGSAPLAAPAAPAPALESESGVERLLPLRDGFVLSYWVSTAASAEREQVIFRVERRSPERASLHAGNRIQRLELAADGVRLLSGGYLLRAPLSFGA